MPKLTVIIPVYNAARYLNDALESVCAQSLADLELIAVDNGSNDDSPQILREVAARDAVEKWMAANFGKRGAMELHYRDIKPKIVIMLESTSIDLMMVQFISVR